MLDRGYIPPISDFQSLKIIHPISTELRNGVVLKSIEMGDQPVSRLTVTFPVGLAETTDTEALILMSNTMREGTDRMSSSEISDILEYNGAWFVSEYETHSTSFSLFTLNSRFSEVFPIFCRILSNPTFPDNIVPLIGERLASMTEFKMKKNVWHADRIYQELIFGEGHPLAKTESPERFRKIDANYLKTTYDSTIASSVPTIYLTGKIDTIYDQVRDYFESLNFYAGNPRLNIIPFRPSQQKQKTTELPEAMQSAVKMAIPTIGRNHPDYIALRLAVKALGGYFGSRLMKNIREEKGLTYGIDAALLGYREGGVTVVSTQTDNRYVDKVVEETVKEIENMSHQPLAESELRALKQHSMTALVSILDTPFSVMDHFMSIDTNGSGEDYFERQFETIKNLSSEEIMRVSGLYLKPDNLRIAIAGHLS